MIILTEVNQSKLTLAGK